MIKRYRAWKHQRRIIESYMSSQAVGNKARWSKKKRLRKAKEKKEREGKKG